MPRGDDRRSRARVNSEAVNKSARRSRGGNVLRLSEGIPVWFPEEAETFAVRVLPYQVTHDYHPDPVKKGQYWYRRPYGVHFDVGGTGVDIVCPRHFGAKCPVCEAAKVLSDQDYNKHKEEIRALRPKQFVAYAIIDAKGDHTKVVLFDWSRSKFSDKLDDEVKRAGPEVLGFSNADDGMVIKFRTSEETYQGKTFYTTDRIDFVDARDLASVSDDVLDAVPKLDDCFEILPYETIDALLHGADTSENKDKNEDVDPPKSKPKAKDEDEDVDPPKSKPKAKDEADDDDW
jgi:hypothetical protein